MLHAAYRLGCIYMDKEDTEHYDGRESDRIFRKKQRIVQMEMSMQQQSGHLYGIKSTRNTMMQRKAIGYLEKSS